MLDRVVLGHFCVELSGTGTFLCWTDWHWGIFVLGRVVLGHFCVGLSGTGTFFCWTEWHLDRVVVDRMELGQICGGVSCTGAYFSANFEDFARHSLVHKCSVFLNVKAGGFTLRPLQTAVSH